jgi:hypothetical protein
MTDREKAIVMAHTGICMLKGERLQEFYKYVYELVGRTVWTHELGDPKLVERIRKLSKPDFIKMCEEEDID